MEIKRYLSFTSIYCQRRLLFTLLTYKSTYTFFNSGYLIYIDSSFLKTISYALWSFSKYQANETNRLRQELVAQESILTSSFGCFGGTLYT